MASFSRASVPTLTIDYSPGAPSPEQQVLNYLNDEANLPAVRECGALKIPISKVFLQDAAAAVSRQYDCKDELKFDPATFWGYQMREGSQQEIICRKEGEVVGTNPLYDLMLAVANAAVQMFATGTRKLERRLSPVFWRYDPSNTGGKTDIGFDVHMDFSLIGVTYQCAPGLFWVPEDGTEVDLWSEDEPCIYLMYGAPSAERGFTPFRHGVKRIAGQTRLAGGVFADIIDDAGDDGVAENMADYDAQAAKEVDAAGAAAASS